MHQSFVGHDLNFSYCVTKNEPTLGERNCFYGSLFAQKIKKGVIFGKCMSLQMISHFEEKTPNRETITIDL